MNYLKQKFDYKTMTLAFKTTTPVLFGYLAIGIAFGLLLKNAGYSWVVGMVMSIFIYAGAAQYIAVNFFANNASFTEVATITFLVNFRHMLYGISLFDKFDLTGWLKPYMIFSLTDETYALLTSIKDPVGINKSRFYFYIAIFNHSYWVLGSLIGVIAGNLITINTKGLDFALTALFIVLLIDQLNSYKTRIPFLIGGFCGVVSIITIGRANMLIVSVISSIIIMLMLKKRIVNNESN
ncbi:MAG: AzlC family ABC transporter permease [Ignavibacteriaceae bacterium]|nr:AzlC family ABC transporter permease [Ignavibacteriaceae bacterium]